jgi:PPE family
MYFAFLPPEVNSGRMYVGPGSGPMLAAAALVNLRQQGLRLFVVGRRGRLPWLRIHAPGDGPGEKQVPLYSDQ